jgi:hypothetical protein
MGATLTTVSAILKEIYEPDIQDQMNSEAKGLKRIERTNEGVTNDVGGRYVVFPLRVGRNHGIGARNENEALPTAGQQKTVAARVGLKYLYGSIRFTGQTLKLADNNKQAFASAVDEEMTGLKRDLRKDMNFQFYGEGTGKRATLTADGVNTVTVDTVQYLEVDMMIDIVDTDNVTIHASNRMITAINTTTKVVTYNGADVSAATNAGDYVVRTGNLNREMTGLAAIIKDTGTLYNVDPVVTPLWKSVRNHNSGTPRALTEALMAKVSDDVGANGGNVTVGFYNRGVRRAYFNLLKSERRHVNTTKFEGGFTGLAFATDDGDIPLVSDDDAPFGKIIFANEKSIKLYQEADWEWMDYDGNKFEKVTGFDAYEATMFKYCEMGTHRRNTHGVLEDITEA